MTEAAGKQGRGDRLRKANGCSDGNSVAFNPVGQVVGQMCRGQSNAEFTRDLLTEFVDAVDRLNAALPGGND
jgi:hypothetical protein